MTSQPIVVTEEMARLLPGALRYLRLLRGQTLADVAGAAQASRQMISAIEQGTETPGPDLLARLVRWTQGV